MNVFTNEETRQWSKTLDGKMCTACLAIIVDDKVLMVKARYKDYWSFPSGVVDTGESPLQAALRETREEVGLAVDSQTVDPLVTIYTVGTNGDRDRFNIGFVTYFSDLPQTLAVPSDEIEVAEWVAFDQITERALHKPSYETFQIEIMSSPDTRRRYVEL